MHLYQCSVAILIGGTVIDVQGRYDAPPPPIRLVSPRILCSYLDMEIGDGEGDYVSLDAEAWDDFLESRFKRLSVSLDPDRGAPTTSATATPAAGAGSKDPDADADAAAAVADGSAAAASVTSTSGKGGGKEQGGLFMPPPCVFVFHLVPKPCAAIVPKTSVDVDPPSTSRVPVQGKGRGVKGLLFVRFCVCICRVNVHQTRPVF